MPRGEAAREDAASVALDADVRVDRGAFRLDVRLRVGRGETVAIMGPSAAGKSTLLHAIGGLVRPTSGSVRVGGRVVSGPAGEVPVNRRGVVLLGQDPRLFPHLSARDNIAFGRRARGASRGVARREADEWLARVGLPEAGDRRPAALSGGQQQRVALARALVTEPVALLLDEPLTALDQVTADGIRSLLAAHLRRATTLIVTHDAVDAAALADRLVIVEGGRVAQEGAVRDVLASPATPFAASIAGLNRVVGEARGGAWTAGGMTLTTPDPASAALVREEGRALAAVFRPGAVRIARADAGAPDPAATGPGRWVSRVSRLEQTPAGVRVHTRSPDVVADVPVEAVTAFGLTPGTPVMLAVAPDDVRLVAADAVER